MIFKGDAARGDLNGFLDAGSNMQGELSFEDTFRVDGKLTGKIVSTGDLVVGENGVVDAVVEVHRVYVTGTLKGSVAAAERIEITSGGRLLGDIVTPTLVIEEGGFFEGRCAMESPSSLQEGKPASVTPLKAKREV